MSEADGEDKAKLLAELERLDRERKALQARLATLTQTGGGAWSAARHDRS